MDTDNNGSKVPGMFRNIFGIIMIIVYVGMGVLCMLNYFQFTGDFAWLRWVAGAVLVLYGFWRAYRQFKGIDPDITSRD